MRNGAWKKAAGLLLAAITLFACAAKQEEALPDWSLPEGKGARDNTSVCLVPQMSGEDVRGNDFAEVDCSNITEGYIYARYLGTNGKVKLQITGSDEVKYTYSMKTDGTADVFPLSAGSGTYHVEVYENIQLNQYALAFATDFEVTLRNEFLPFLYPNQYVTFEAGDDTIALGEELARPANEDLDVVSNVYNYLIRNISYDTVKAENAQSGYLPVIDEVLHEGKGICLDYAALMCAMLRSQRIPTRMEVGLAGTAYHAWISVHIEEIGWINGMIEFDGQAWNLMDPTFAASTAAEELRNYIGDGDNYELKYVY